MADARPVLTSTVRPPRARLRLAGEFDLADRDRICDVLTCLRSDGCLSVEVDAQDVAFIDASCLRVLHTQAQALRDCGGALRLVAASTTFVKIAELAGYHDLLGHEPAYRSPRGVPRPRSGESPREASPGSEREEAGA